MPGNVIIFLNID